MTTDTKKEKLAAILTKLDEAACDCGGELHEIIPDNMITNEDVLCEIELAISEIECFQGTIELSLEDLKALR